MESEWGREEERKRERERKERVVEWLRYFRTAQVGNWGKRRHLLIKLEKCGETSL